ncbi:MAG: hypothetical protein LAO23_06665 [Acidobacteriia bacterium]|nr:hypothetical protein [Terriglobia bacterium]
MADELNIEELEKQKSGTTEDFIVSWPLYTPFDFFQFEVPQRINRDCPQCKKETTWTLYKQASLVPSEELKDETKWLHYLCHRCSGQHLMVLYREIGQTPIIPKRRISSGLSNHPSTPNTPAPIMVLSKVLKVGQFPEVSIDIPKALEGNLGPEDAAAYKKALISRNHGFGLGAVTYMRRVVENKTDELLEVVAQVAESHDIDPTIIEKIRAVKVERTTYDQKLKLAATVLPSSLTPNGANPLGELYKLVSEGIHDMSEKDCIGVADHIRSAFEFTFTHLREDAKERQDFALKIQRLAGGERPLRSEPEPER